jgi:hypothetical protein
MNNKRTKSRTEKVYQERRISIYSRSDRNTSAQPLVEGREEGNMASSKRTLEDPIRTLGEIEREREPRDPRRVPSSKIDE